MAYYSTSTAFLKALGNYNGVTRLLSHSLEIVDTCFIFPVRKCKVCTQVIKQDVNTHWYINIHPNSACKLFYFNKSREVLNADAGPIIMFSLGQQGFFKVKTCLVYLSVTKNCKTW